MGGAEGNSSIPISHFPQAGSKWYEWEEVGGEELASERKPHLAQTANMGK